MIKLERAEFFKFVDILKSIDDWKIERLRWRLVNAVLKGLEDADRIEGLLELDGSAQAAAVSLLDEFQRLGAPDPGKELIGILANTLIDVYLVDDEPIAFLRGLFHKYPLDKPVASKAKIDEWQGDENSDAVTEKIIGEDTLLEVMVLELAMNAAKAVVRIRTQDELGTGFLCGENLIMTNHHVIPDKDMAKNSSFTFFYEVGTNGIERPAVTVSANPEGLFFTDPDLDVTVLQIQETPAGVEPLWLRRERTKTDDRVSIIQHPGGHYKKISMQNNFVAYADKEVLQYTTSTEPGSSGSPVFNEIFNVIGIHHSGGNLLEPKSNRRYLRNAGTTMIAALNAIKAEEPALYDKLNVV